ncbi:MAG: hypothetical protein ABTQ73_02375 [Caldilineales bacterium]
MPERSVFFAARRGHWAAGLMLLGWLLLVAGYWGPWVMAQPAGLRVLGLDLAEYVKFMAPVRSGEISLTREVFYLPLVALSLSLSLLAQRRELPFPAPLRWLLNLAAIPAALALLPPAWTPPLLLTPEFSKQSAALVACVAAALLAYPLWRRLPGRALLWLLLLLILPAALLPLPDFAHIHPALTAIYGGAVRLGRGLWQTPLGLLLVLLAAVVALMRPRP